jgi:hypothetical protein
MAAMLARIKRQVREQREALHGPCDAALAV